MIGAKLIKVELTSEDAELFKKFRQHQDMFNVLLNSGVFNVKWGQATLNFDTEGVLRDIKLSTTCYQFKNVQSRT